MSIGPSEIVIVLILALLVFGPKRLPQMGKSLGKGVREFRKAAETAKTELGLGEVTDQINEVKATFTEPLKEVTGTIGDLKANVDLKSAIEAPVAGAAAAGTVAGAATAITPAPAQPAGAFDAGPETPDVTPQTVFADVTPADVTPPPAPEAPAPETTADAPSEAPAADAVEAPEAPSAPETPGVDAVTAGPPADPSAGA